METFELMVLALTFASLGTVVFAAIDSKDLTIKMISVLMLIISITLFGIVSEMNRFKNTCECGFTINPEWSYCAKCGKAIK